jgi:hypothetical protein
VTHLRVVADHSPVGSLLELAEHESIAGVKQAVSGVDADTLRVLGESTPLKLQPPKSARPGRSPRSG